MKYEDLLKDPRWQKRRLEIMQRDNFTCQRCGVGLDDGIPLNVHHLVYRRCYPWEYYDYELVTLCENCHKDSHKKQPEAIVEKVQQEVQIQTRDQYYELASEAQTQSSKTSKMPKSYREKSKIPFYKSLIDDNMGLTPNEQIVYCFIVSRCILAIDGVFDCGTFNFEKVDYIISSNNGFLNLPLDWYDENGNMCCGRKIAKLSNVTNTAVSYSLNTLKEKHLIDSETKSIFVSDIWKSGYFELFVHKHPKLKGQLLIFYSWIYDNSKLVNHASSRTCINIAKKFNTSKVAMRDLIHRLHGLGLAERLHDGKLLIK